MSRFVLIPGAGGMSWYWHRLVPELVAGNHQAVAIDLPGDDELVGLPEYADAVIEVIGDDQDTVLVAQSLGAFTAAVVCSRTPVRLLVLVNAMIPIPGETPGEWFTDTGAEKARIAAAKRGRYPVDFDLEHYFLHDVPKDVLATGEAVYREEGQVVFGQHCQIDGWPSVPTRVLVARDDRFFPAEFQRRVALDRIGLGVDLVPGGHLVALSHPRELAERLMAFR